MSDSKIPHARNAGVATFMNLPFSTDLAGVDVAIVGIPYDLGGEAGARHAPRAIRNVSWMLRSVHGTFHIDVRKWCRAVDFGDVAVHPSSREWTFASVEAALGVILQADAVPIILGGDHSLLLPELRAMRAVHGSVALVQVDAHTDTQNLYYADEKYTSGTVVRRAVEEGLVQPERSIQVGIRGTVYSEDDHRHSAELGLAKISMDELVALGMAGTIKAVRERVRESPVFVTFDMDSVDPAFAPGTGRPEPGGLSSREALALIRGLRGLRTVGFDITEVNPFFDAGQTTCVLASHVAFEFMSIIAFSRRAGGLPA